MEKKKRNMIGMCNMQEEKSLHFRSKISKEDRPVFWETGWINVKLSLRLINYVPSQEEVWWEVGVKVKVKVIPLR
jgi:hypothetical protein